MKNLEELQSMKPKDLIELVLILQENQRGLCRARTALALLEGAPQTISGMAERMETTNKNVSSILSGLRRNGAKILSWQEGGVRWMQLG